MMMTVVFLLAFLVSAAAKQQLRGGQTVSAVQRKLQDQMGEDGVIPFYEYDNNNGGAKYGKGDSSAFIPDQQPIDDGASNVEYYNSNEESFSSHAENTDTNEENFSSNEENFSSNEGDLNSSEANNNPDDGNYNQDQDNYNQVQGNQDQEDLYDNSESQQQWANNEGNPDEVNFLKSEPMNQDQTYYESLENDMEDSGRQLLE